MAMEHTPEQIRARALEEAEEAVWAYHIFHQPGTWTAQERRPRLTPSGVFRST